MFRWSVDQFDAYLCPSYSLECGAHTKFHNKQQCFDVLYQIQILLLKHANVPAMMEFAWRFAEAPTSIGSYGLVQRLIEHDVVSQ